MSNELPTCPYCLASTVTLVGSVGVKGEVTLLRCDKCGKEWNEILDRQVTARLEHSVSPDQQSEE